MELRKKLLRVSKAISYLKKDKTNKFQGYDYLSEAKVKERVKLLFDEEGVLFNFTIINVREYEISPTKSGIKQFCTVADGNYSFLDVDSEEEIKGTWCGTGTDTGDKGIYKAITGGIKYILMTNFLIPTGEDPENEIPDRTDKVNKIEQQSKVSVTEQKQESLKFTEVQKEKINNVKTTFNIKTNSDLNKYVKYWAEKNNIKLLTVTFKDITPTNIDTFCDFITKHGHEVIPF